MGYVVDSFIHIYVNSNSSRKKKVECDDDEIDLLNRTMSTATLNLYALHISMIQVVNRQTHTHSYIMQVFGTFAVAAVQLALSSAFIVHT